ncbi:MAG: pseudouridine synthase [Anaerolineae bacterium]
MTAPRRPREERLHKILARAGVASRRKCEDLIREGRVQVDGQTVQEVGLKLDPSAHRIAVDGKEVDVRPQKVYLLLHKPRGYLCTTEDPFGRPVVLDLVDTDERLFPVGRLDQESEGLVLLTNDGELAHRLMHPRYGHWREYWVLVEGEPTPRDLEHLRSGVPLEDGPTAPARVKVLSGDEEEVAALLGPVGPGQSALSIKIREGRKRQVRRMMEALGLPVVRLVRVALGPLRLGRLPAGQWRPLRPGELRALLAQAGLAGPRPERSKQGRRLPPKRRTSTTP